jgi:hypothetical protein
MGASWHGQMAVKHCQQAHLDAFGYKLPSHFIGYNATNGMTHEEVGAFGLQSLHFIDVVRSQLFHPWQGEMTISAGISHAITQAVNGLVGSEAVNEIP